MDNSDQTNWTAMFCELKHRYQRQARSGLADVRLVEAMDKKRLGKRLGNNIVKIHWTLFFLKVGTKRQHRKGCADDD